MAKASTSITLGHVEAIAAKFRDLPAADNKERNVTKQETVRILFKEIKDLQKRGYTLPQVVELLNKEGVNIGEASLRSYLNRASGKKGKQQKAATAKAPLPSPITTATVATKPKQRASFTVAPDTDDI